MTIVEDRSSFYMFTLLALYVHPLAKRNSWTHTGRQKWSEWSNDRPIESCGLRRRNDK